MTEREYKNSLYELSEIFKILDKDLVVKIPERLKRIIEKDKSINYTFRLDYSKRLSEQNLSETTQLFLTTLHLKYWCNEEEKRQILKKMKNNDKKNQEELIEKYNPDNLFNNKCKIEESKNSNEEIKIQKNQMTELKEYNLFRKIYIKIKKILMK